MENIKVAIVEDTDEIREALRVLINGSLGFECLNAFPDAESAILNLPGKDIDAVIMDIHLPKINGVKAVEHLKKVMPQTQFMMYTVHDDDDHVFEALRAGATGYILKRTSPAQILIDLKDLVNGCSPMSGEIARKIVESMQRGKQLSRKDAEELTEREMEILELLQKGLIYKEVADKLCISKDTVKKHIQHIYQKLQVQTRMEAVNKVFR